ncbi:MAG: hypothetical protein A2381_04600 [Bdellovibrionales bacterium RIFOXYB1_FULL_37_110]|nr:MAG: hypothetical protein A2417_16180 [Bdellovibrionales bacterium RIFOXYC1_FULL_37_79]OFZ57447.1 MAG: hypothetical protein A2381_04600 [Bdellovibrionales bacterium RIFOXYB1_FULL_37_110]OFZ63402.1 MAG: hypothetical protein A2328_07180 [Bdellovibrionales bacterium RIFOXYB2_FULL_36_6]OFZ64539.1 MAG: hypothetical protein A2577_13705 [Bdellovibrionales bacterium RIFOXYD1_FULL_36_51]
MNSFFKFMQVINLTPDSFSDGGKYNSDVGLKKRIEEAITWNTPYLDIGAQSTAPMNDPIVEDEEMKRFEKYLIPALIHKLIPSNIILSVDTYRPAVFDQVYRWIKEHLPYNQIIFNDVSGVLDQELIDLMKKYPDFKYVYCHTGIKDRTLTGFHMDHVVDCPSGEMISFLRNYFLSALSEFEKYYFLDRVILDPAFGFSKTTEHNLKIIQSIDTLVEGLGETWLLGISRKSFFKKLIYLSALESDSDMQREYLHVATLCRWMHRLTDKNIIIRGHDPAVFWSAYHVTHWNF